MQSYVLIYPIDLKDVSLYAMIWCLSIDKFYVEVLCSIQKCSCTCTWSDKAVMPIVVCCTLQSCS